MKLFMLMMLCASAQARVITGTKTVARYDSSMTEVTDPHLGRVRLPSLAMDPEMNQENCPGCGWTLDLGESTVAVKAPRGMQDKLTAAFVRVDGWRGRLLRFMGFFADSAMGFGGDHFTSDTSANYTAEQDGTAATWTITGGALVQTGGTADSRFVRNTDASTNTTLWTRIKTNVDAVVPFSQEINHQSATQFYLSYGTADTWKIYYKDGGYTQIGSTASTISDNTYYVMRFTSLTDGSNKILNLYIDGTLKVGPVTTATLFGSGRYGVGGNTAAGGATVTTDWSIADPNLSITSVSPTTGPTAGGQAVTFTVVDGGWGYLWYRGGSALTSTGNSGTTIITGTTPSGSGSAAASIAFGTAGSEEFTASLAAAYTFQDLPKGGMMLLGVGQ